MSLSNPIENLVEKAKLTLNREEKKQIIDNIASYGKEGQYAITDIVQNTAYDDVKEHGLEKIQQINRD